MKQYKEELNKYRIALKNEELRDVSQLDFWENWKYYDCDYKLIEVKARIVVKNNYMLFEVYNEEEGSEHLYSYLGGIGSVDMPISSIVAYVKADIELAFKTIGWVATYNKRRVSYNFMDLMIQLNDLCKKRKRKKAIKKRAKFIHNSSYCPYSKTYIMKDKNTGLYKIGKSKDPKHREKTLQSEKPTIKMVKVFNRDIERDLHERYVDQRVRGEWFELTPIQVKYICTHY